MDERHHNKFFLLLLMLCLCLSSYSQADQIKYLTHGQTALAARILEIRRARQSIDVATFEFSPCDPGIKLVIQELLAKSNEHVHIRVLVDAFNLKKTDRDNMQAIFTRAGIEFRIFNENILLGQNNRSHVKLQIIDGNDGSDRPSLISGGRNLQGRYFSLTPGMNYVDREVLVLGPVAKQAATYFNELWQSSYTSKPRNPGTSSSYEYACLAQNEADSKTIDLVEKEGLKAIRQIPTRVCSDIKLFGDAPDFLSLKYGEPAPGDVLNDDRLVAKRDTAMMIQFINETQKSIAFENWAYLPIYREETALASLRQRQIPILVVTNAQAPNDGDLEPGTLETRLERRQKTDSTGSENIVPVCGTGSMNDNSPLTPVGVRWVIHSKVAVRDGKDVVIGSFNLDPRSYHTNLEANLRVQSCAPFAQDVQDDITNLLKNYQQDAANHRCQTSHPTNVPANILGWMIEQFL